LCIFYGAINTPEWRYTHRAEVIPTAPDNLEVGEIGLPHLVDGGDLVFELVSCPDPQMRGRLDQVSLVQNTALGILRRNTLPGS